MMLVERLGNGVAGIIAPAARATLLQHAPHYPAVLRAVS